MILKDSILLRGLVQIYRSYFAIRRRKFGYIGRNVKLIPPLKIVNPSNVYLYDNTKISNATILAVNAKFIMKRYSGSTSGLMVLTGDHSMPIGRFYRSITESEKPQGLDKDIIVEEDVWIGTNVTLLCGVHVGRGAVIGAGSVIRSNIPPYAKVIGNPAKVVGFRYSPDEIIEHEKILYSEDERLPKEQLEKNYQKYYVERIGEIKHYIR